GWQHGSLQKFPFIFGTSRAKLGVNANSVHFLVCFDDCQHTGRLPFEQGIPREELPMGKQSKSRRFSQHSADAVKKHDEVFPYRSRFSEVKRNQDDTDSHTLGGV